jgi:hypothetical protein
MGNFMPPSQSWQRSRQRTGRITKIARRSSTPERDSGFGDRIDEPIRQDGTGDLVRTGRISTPQRRIREEGEIGGAERGREGCRRGGVTWMDRGRTGSAAGAEGGGGGAGAAASGGWGTDRGSLSGLWLAS